MTEKSNVGSALVNMSRGQGNEILDQIENTCKKMGVSPNSQASMFIRDQFFEKQIRKHLWTQGIDRRFGEPVFDCFFEVPEGYSYDGQITRIKKKYRFNRNDKFLSDANFSQASSVIEPGEEYRILFIPIYDSVNTETCLGYIRHTWNGLLVGAQGLGLVFEHLRSEIPKGRDLFSLDKESNLGVDQSTCPLSYLVPYVGLLPNGKTYTFETRPNRYAINKGSLLLVVFKP